MQQTAALEELFDSLLESRAGMKSTEGGHGDSLSHSGSSEEILHHHVCQNVATGQTSGRRVEW